MTFTSKTLVRAGVALALTLGAAVAMAQTSFSMTYKGGSTSACSTSYNITGKSPAGSGKHPLFVYIGGTGESYTSLWGGAALNAAVARGFVAASVEYDNASFGTCDAIGTRAKCIFNSANANSAVAKLCARATADCSSATGDCLLLERRAPMAGNSARSRAKATGLVPSSGVSSHQRF